MKHVTPGAAWALKKSGYPQPSVQVGQLWANSFGHVSVIFVQHLDRGFRARQLNNPEKFTYWLSEAYIRNTAAYVPTIEEANNYYEKG